MRTRFFCAVMLAIFWLHGLESARAATFTVINTNDSGAGSLRQAIFDANNTVGWSLIQFNIPGGGPHTIQPLTPLPLITNVMTIDGFSQPGSKPNTSPAGCNAVLKIELDGSLAGANADGIFTAGGVTLQGLVINRFSGAGINAVMSAGKLTVRGNYLGTDTTGLIARPNATGCLLRGDHFSSIQIGGETIGDRNVISGNTFHGIDTATASQSFSGPNGPITGNYIGVDATGVRALGNGNDGIRIRKRSGRMTVTGNVISGNGGSGISSPQDTTDASTIMGNAFGTDSSGIIPIGNASNGVYYGGSLAVQVGGIAPREGNIISANGTGGIVAALSAGWKPLVPWVGNSVFGNGGLQIDLEGNDLPSRVTTNDVNDVDDGPNGFQNFPALGAITTNGGVYSVAATLNSKPNEAYRIDFYRSPVPDPSGFGGGKNYVGTTNVITDGSGNVAFSFSTTIPLLGQWITAIARDTNGVGASSEFSQAVAASGTFGGNVQFGTVGTVVNESAGVASLQLIRTDSSSGSVTVFYATSDGIAVAGSDYSTTNGSVTFGPGETNNTITVPILQDNAGETLEGFSVMLTNVTADGALGLITTAQINIDDDDPLPLLSVNDVAQAEGDVGTSFIVFTVSLSATSSVPVSVAYTNFSGTAKLPGDHLAAYGVLTFAPGETEKPLAMPVNGDKLYESNELFSVVLNNPTNAVLARVQGIATIMNDDTIPTISINDVTNSEGSSSGIMSFVFTLTLTGLVEETVSVSYSTSPSTATPGIDYQNKSGVVTFFPGGPTNQNLVVDVIRDDDFEPDETFFVNLSNAVNATIVRAQGTATILNDDMPPPLPSVSISDISITEGDSGTKFAAFSVTLSSNSSLTVSVNYSTTNGTAAAPEDFAATSGILSFSPGETIKAVVVTVKGDADAEPDEEFYVNLSSPTNAVLLKVQGTGTILNDDGLPPLPTIEINDIAVSEGDSGVTFAVLSVMLSPTSSVPVSVSYATTNGTAVAPGDFSAASGVLAFSPGETVKPVVVTIQGDTNAEPNEVFYVNLSSPTNATISQPQGAVGIVNDDMAWLSVANLGSAVVLSWPTNYEGFQLYFSTNLTVSNAWLPSAAPISISNGFNTVSELASNWTRFYQLKTP